MSPTQVKEHLEHQESTAAETNKFLNHLHVLVKEGTVVNPFKEMDPEFIKVDTGEVVGPEVATRLKEASNISVRAILFMFANR